MTSSGVLGTLSRSQKKGFGNLSVKLWNLYVSSNVRIRACQTKRKGKTEYLFSWPNRI